MLKFEQTMAQTTAQSLFVQEKRNTDYYWHMSRHGSLFLPGQQSQEALYMYLYINAGTQAYRRRQNG